MKQDVSEEVVAVMLERGYTLVSHNHDWSKSNFRCEEREIHANVFIAECSSQTRSIHMELYHVWELFYIKSAVMSFYHPRFVEIEQKMQAGIKRLLFREGSEVKSDQKSSMVRANGPMVRSLI